MGISARAYERTSNMFTTCKGCGLESPAWHVYSDGTCIDCAPDSTARYDALDALNDARDAMRAGRI